MREKLEFLKKFGEVLTADEFEQITNFCIYELGWAMQIPESEADDE